MLKRPQKAMKYDKKHEYISAITRVENLRLSGSIPPPGTILIKRLDRNVGLFLCLKNVIAAAY